MGLLNQMAVDPTTHTGTTSPTILLLREMSAYDGFLVLSQVLVATTGMTKLELVACSDGQGSNPTGVASSGTLSAHTVGDEVYLECAISDVIKAAGAIPLRWVGLRVTLGNVADKVALTMIRFTRNGRPFVLTANKIAA
jgi:hypothetical protein